jgi:hypothetical protein
MDSRRNPTIVLVGLQESGCCSTEVCCDDYLVQPKRWISNVLFYCSPYCVCSIYQISNQYLIERQNKVQTTKVWTKNTSLRAITQPKIFRPERNSSKKCKNIIHVIYYLLCNWFPQLLSVCHSTSITSQDCFWKWSEIHVLLSRYLLIYNNSAKNHSTGTKFELKL